MVIIPQRWPTHWHMISRMLRDHYSQDFTDNDLMLMGVCNKDTVESYRLQYPDHERIIVFQCEPLLSESHYWNPQTIINNMQGADEIWDYDYENYQLLLDHGLPAKFCPLLFSDENRTCSVTRPKDIDILVYGLFTARRGHWLHELHMAMNPDVKIYSVCNVLHPDIDQLVDRSKVIVNWHQHPDQWQQEQTRISWLLTNGKNVVSERSRINYYGDLIREFDTVTQMTDHLTDILRGWSPTSELRISSEFMHMSRDTFLQRALEKVSDEALCDQ